MPPKTDQQRAAAAAPRYHLFHPEDTCGISPVTKLRIGPSALATFIIVVLGLFALSTLLALGRQGMDSTLGVGKRLLIVVGMVIYVVGFYGYFINYRQCRPWIGFFVFMVAGSVMAAVVGGDELSKRRNQFNRAADATDALVGGPKVVNGRFDAPALGPSDTAMVLQRAPEGWSLVGAHSIRIVRRGVQQCLEVTGYSVALTQSVSGFVVGKQYTLGVDIDFGATASSPDTMVVSIDDREVLRVTKQQPPSAAITYPFTATDTMHRVTVALDAPPATGTPFTVQIREVSLS